MLTLAEHRILQQSDLQSNGSGAPAQRTGDSPQSLGRFVMKPIRGSQYGRHMAHNCSEYMGLLEHQGETCPDLRVAASGHSRCSRSNRQETFVQEAVYERNVEHAFGADLRGSFHVLADAGRPQLGRVSRAAAVRSSQCFGSWVALCVAPFNSTRSRLKPLLTPQ